MLYLVFLLGRSCATCLASVLFVGGFVYGIQARWRVNESVNSYPHNLVLSLVQVAFNFSNLILLSML